MGSLRSRLTYANIVATSSLVMVVGGGTAIAATVISSNAQIKKNTVAGHLPPRGKHANLIAGSVNATDLAANAVNGSKVKDGSLAGADLNVADVADTLGMRHEVDMLAPGQTSTLWHGTIWTLTAACADDGAGFTHASVALTTSQPVLIALDGSPGLSTTSQTLAATTSDNAAEIAGRGFTAHMAPLGGALYLNWLEGHVLAATDFGTSPTCVFQFDGTGQ